MATTAEALAQIAAELAPATRPAPQAASADGAGAGSDAVLLPWVWTQAVNVTRHAAALRPFRRDEFGTTSAAPTAGHVEAVNALLTKLRRGLLAYSKRVSGAAEKVKSEPSTAGLQALVNRKESAHQWVQGIEKIWDFYLELFGQRQSRYANWLLSCDRIALDCYRAAYLGLGVARSIPAPPPFSYMRTGFSPSTFRRGIPLARLGKQINPFPLIELPYHRLVNPWTLGAVLHEVSHNLQTDLGLSKDIPRRVAERLLKAGLDRRTTFSWTRWNREMFADMSALLLGGPEVVGSLMDVIARGTATVVHFNPRGVHPTPYLRMLNSVELLRRMGFAKEAEQYRRAWKRVYPTGSEGSIPAAMLKSFPKACALAVDAMCYQPYPSLGNKSVAQVYAFGRKEQQMVEEAAKRLASGTDPGIIPERFVIAAARIALRRRMARPGVIARNFYKTLASG
jgi:hypothetical protein